MIANNSIIPDIRVFKTELHGIELLEKLQIVSKSSVGVYCLLPLGVLIVDRLEDIVRRKFDEAGFFEVRFPTLMTEKAWRKSLRWESFNSLLRIQDRSKKNLCLNPTHEEAAVETINSIFSSYKDLPITLFCLNKVYRDEIRPKYGLLRTKEFIMADAYSFTVDNNSMLKEYDHLLSVHRAIFEALFLDCIRVSADNGDIGGSTSIEFVYLDHLGECSIIGCNDCGIWTSKFNRSNSKMCQTCGGINIIQKKGIELAHVFQLDQRYTTQMDMKFLNSENRFEYPYMNCSGIGITRLLQVLVEESVIKYQQIVPTCISPFDILIYTDSSETNLISHAKNLYSRLSELKYSVLLDVRKIPEKHKLILGNTLNCKVHINFCNSTCKIRCENIEVEVLEIDTLDYIKKIITR